MGFFTGARVKINQGFALMMRESFNIGFIDFISKGKSLSDFPNIFSSLEW